MPCLRGEKMQNEINERPGEVVCICEKNGNVSLWDPGAWRRTMTIHYRQADKRENEEDDDD